MSKGKKNFKIQNGNIKNYMCDKLDTCKLKVEKIISYEERKKKNKNVAVGEHNFIP